MHKVVGFSTALIFAAGGCGSPESYQDHPMTESATIPRPTSTEKLVEESLVSADALQRIFDERLIATQQRYPKTFSRLRILDATETTHCSIVKDVMSFSLQGSDPTVAYNCLENETIVVSTAFLDTHINPSSDPKNAANILLSHEIAHTVMNNLGIDALKTDKTKGERIADCLAGNTFASLAPDEQLHVSEVFTESIQTVSDDTAGREAAFAKGLAGVNCVQ